MRSFARRWTVAAGLALLAVLLSAGVAAALTADAGGNQTVNEGDLVTLDGRGSTQSEGRPILSYAWAQVDDDGPTVELTGANMPVATFTAPEVDAEGAVLEFELTVTDDLGDSDTDSVTITVTNVNQTPILTTIPNQSVSEGQTITVSLSASDPDGDALRLSVAGLPGFCSLTDAGNGTGSIGCSPDFGDAGNYSMVVTATDDGSPPLSDSKSFNLSVGFVDRPPQLSPIGNKTVAEGQLLSFTVSASDPDGDSVTITTSALPTGATFDGTTFNWTPTFTQSGSYPVTFTATANGLTDSETITITVTNVDRPPVLAPIGNKTVAEGQLLSFAVSATDPDGDAVTITTSALPTGATFNGTTFSWTPSFTQAGSYQVTFTATANGLTDSETITITVTNVNRAPILTAISNQSVAEGQSITIPLSASDPDENGLRLSAAGLPAFCSLTDAGNGTGSIGCSPSFGHAGNYGVVVTATDDGSPPLSDSKSFNLSVGFVDRPPQLSPIGNKTVAEGQLLSFAVSATDPDGDPVTITAAPLPNGATFDGTTFSWTPGFDQAGSYPVTFTATANGLTDSETITITVTDVNRLPVADAGPDQTVREGEPIFLNGSNSHDPDEPEGFIVAYRWVQVEGPEGGELVAPDEAVTEFLPPPVPPEGAAFVFQLTVTDDLGGAGTDTTVVNVSLSLAPVADAGPDQAVAEGTTVFLDGSASTHPDPLGFIASYAWVQIGGPAVALIHPDTVGPSFAAPLVWPGEATLTFQLTVTDELGLLGTDRVLVNVVSVNRPPTANAGSDAAATEGTTVTLDGSGSQDPEGRALAYAWRRTQGPAVTLSSASAVSPTFVAPPVGEDGASLVFELTVTDDRGLAATDSVGVFVENNGIEGFPPDVTTVLGATGDEAIGFKVLTLTSGLVFLEALDPLSLPSSPSSPLDLPYGLFSLRLKVANPGDTVTLRVYLPEPAPEGYVWLKYDPASDDWVDYSAVGALFDEEAGRRELLVTLVDGRIGDSDGSANGVIVDPAGLGLPSPSGNGGGTPVADGGGGMGGFCFIRALVR